MVARLMQLGREEPGWDGMGWGKGEGKGMGWEGGGEGQGRMGRGGMVAHEPASPQLENTPPIHVWLRTEAHHSPADGSPAIALS